MRRKLDEKALTGLKSARPANFVTRGTRPSFSSF